MSTNPTMICVATLLGTPMVGCMQQTTTSKVSRRNTNAPCRVSPRDLGHTAGAAAQAAAAAAAAAAV